MPMEDIDKNEVSDDGISDEEELLHREVIQGDADLYYLLRCVQYSAASFG